MGDFRSMAGGSECRRWVMGRVGTALFGHVACIRHAFRFFSDVMDTMISRQQPPTGIACHSGTDMVAMCQNGLEAPGWTRDELVCLRREPVQF